MWAFPPTDDSFAILQGCKGPACLTNVDGQTYIEGATCKGIIDDDGDDDNGGGGGGAPRPPLLQGKASCMFGQIDEVRNHYEETLSASVVVIIANIGNRTRISWLIPSQ